MRSTLRNVIAGAGLLALGAACGDPPPPPPPPPPEVRLLPVAPQVVGPSLSFGVTVSGCSTVARVRVLDRELLLAEVPGAGSTTTVTVEAAKVDFRKRGLAAQLSVLAEAECDDGRSGRSGQSPVTFLPAAERHEGPWPFDDFFVEPGGKSLLGCSKDLVRLDTARAEKARFASGFDCSAGDHVLFGEGGAIAFVQPGRGASLLDASLRRTAKLDQVGLKELLVPQLGPLLTLGFDGVFFLDGYDRATGARAWTARQSVGRPAARLLHDSVGRAVFVAVQSSAFTGYSELELQRYDRGSGQYLGKLSLGRIRWDQGPPPAYPLVAFDAAGTTAYLSDHDQPEAVIRACDITGANGCTEGAGLKWQSKRLPGGVTTLVPFKKGLVALGPSIAWFLNPETGATIGEPITPTAPVVYAQAVSGADGSLYLLGYLPGE
ncbi:MAG: hypothetical protein ACK4N5_15435, partial [Myxococcales bacterium]